MNWFDCAHGGAGRDPKRAVRVDKFVNGERGRVSSNSPFSHGLEAFSEHLRARVNSFRCTVEHGYRFEKNRIDEVEALSLPLFCGARFCSLDSNKALRNLNPIDCRRDIFSALVPKRYQGTELLCFNGRDPGEIRLNYPDDRGASIDYQSFRNLDLYRANRANGHPKACVYAGRADARGADFIFAFASFIGVGNVERHDNGAARANSGCNVPEVLRRSDRLRDDSPYTEHCQKTNCDQQPNECELSDFPRAFHDSPVFDFGAIVACWTEVAWGL